MEKTQGNHTRTTPKRSSTARRNSLVRSPRHRQKKNQNQPILGLTSDFDPSATNRFALCIDNKGEDDLELRKLYKVLPDESAAPDGFIRIIDESGEDYLYHESLFVMIAVPKNIEQVLALAA